MVHKLLGFNHQVSCPKSSCKTIEHDIRSNSFCFEGSNAFMLRVHYLDWTLCKNISQSQRAPNPPVSVMQYQRMPRGACGHLCTICNEEDRFPVILLQDYCGQKGLERDNRIRCEEQGKIGLWQRDLERDKPY